MTDFPKSQEECLRAFVLHVARAGWSYIANVLRTLAIHKIESQHQNYDRPPIFIKELDDFGIVMSWQFNAGYEGRIQPPPEEFPGHQAQWFFSQLENNDTFCRRFLTMLLIGNTEKTLGQDPNDKPVIRKEIGEDGIPDGYTLNQTGIELGDLFFINGKVFELTPDRPERQSKKREKPTH